MPHPLTVEIEKAAGTIAHQISLGEITYEDENLPNYCLHLLAAQVNADRPDELYMDSFLAGMVCATAFFKAAGGDDLGV
jgi:hypothetical protein